MGDVTELKSVKKGPPPTGPEEIDINQLSCGECGWPQFLLYATEDDGTDIGPIMYGQCTGCGNFQGIGLYVPPPEDEEDE